MIPPLPSPQGIERFRALYKEKFGIDLEGDELYRAAQQTLALVYVLERYDLLPKDSEGRFPH